MFKNIITTVFVLSFVLSFSQTENCKTAKDSVSVRKNRGQIGFYYPTKYQPDQYFYVVFSNGKYTKKQTPLKSVPNDYMMCINKASQKTLDSVFKVDFFRKSDSILNAYDKIGNGYRNTDFPGGAFALQKFLNKNVSLPSAAKPTDADKMIRVYYSFVVDTTGAISDISLVKSNCKECEALVLAAIKMMPNFVPATEAGIPKKLKYIMPFTKKF